MTFLVQPTPCSIQPCSPQLLTSSVRQPPTNTWCKRAGPSPLSFNQLSSRPIASCEPIASLVHRVCVCVCVCVPDRGEHKWVTQFSVPLICSYTLFSFFLFFHFIAIEWRGSWVFSGWLTALHTSRFTKHLRPWIEVHSSSQRANFTPEFTTKSYIFIK